MSTIAELTRRQEELVADRHARARAATEAELQTRADEIKAIQREISATISHGAAPCGTCATLPLGMQRKREVPVGDKKMIVPIFEVGCLVCSGSEHRVQGLSPQEAVTAWNKAQH